jgi:hypothetical protein
VTKIAAERTFMNKVYYIGDWAVQIGLVYAETSFNHLAKGLDMINCGHWLARVALSTCGAKEQSLSVYAIFPVS